VREEVVVLRRVGGRPTLGGHDDVVLAVTGIDDRREARLAGLGARRGQEDGMEELVKALRAA
jgi:hypothetical protein